MGTLLLNLERLMRTQEMTCAQFKCFYCQVTDNLIPNYVSHHLYEEGVITDDDLEELNNHNIPRINRVKTLLEILDRNLNKMCWKYFVEVFNQNLVTF